MRVWLLYDFEGLKFFVVQTVLLFGVWCCDEGISGCSSADVAKTDVEIFIDPTVSFHGVAATTREGGPQSNDVFVRSFFRRWLGLSDVTGKVVVQAVIDAKGPERI